MTHLRKAGGVVLLMILAICGYAGSRRQEKRTVAVSVTRQVYAPEESEGYSAQDSAERLKKEREKEIAMLEAVAANEYTDARTKADAQAQLAQIARCMEVEAQTAACLEEMGFAGSTAFTGAQMMHILTPFDNITDDEDKNRMMDAVCSMTGYEASDIKIILTKK